MGSLGVAVLDIENRRVSTYDHNLRLLSGAVDLVAPDLEDRVGRVRPLSLASDRGGALYVVDAERDRVLVFDYSGAFQREIGGFGGRSGGFAGLSGVAVSARGRIVSVERPRPRPRKGVAPDSTASRARIQWFEAGGRLITSVWSPPLSAGASELSLSIAVDGIGRVAIAAERSGEVYVLTPDGAFLARMQGPVAPRAVAFLADDGVARGRDRGGLHSALVAGAPRDGLVVGVVHASPCRRPLAARLRGGLLVASRHARPGPSGAAARPVVRRAHRSSPDAP